MSKKISEEQIVEILEEWSFLIAMYGLEDDDDNLTVGGMELKEEVRRKVLRLKMPK